MTYSIVARDPETGEMGVAVQTAWLNVGAICPWAEAGVGAVATQASVRPSHGPSGLSLMRNGHSAPEALAAVLAADEHREVRQIGMIDRNGQVAAFTGQNTIRYAGHQTGDNFSVQANMMLNDTVPGAMAEVFTQTQGALVLKIMAALEAAQAAGGDFRGMQSAALKIVSRELPLNSWEGVLYDLRVDDHTEPLRELRRLVDRQRAHNMINDAYLLASGGNVDGALAQFEAAITLDPGEEQIRFWFPVEMADQHGQIERVAPVLRELFKQNPMWIECLRRSTDARPLKTEGMRDQLLALAE